MSLQSGCSGRLVDLHVNPMQAEQVGDKLDSKMNILRTDGLGFVRQIDTFGISDGLPVANWNTTPEDSCSLSTRLRTDARKSK